MADVNDTNALSQRLENTIEKIETADVDEADREAIQDYAEWKRRRAASVNTARIYIRGVTLSAERYDGRLTAIENASEVEALITAHEKAGCTAAKSINSKLDGLRDFWRWCETTGHGVEDYRWVDLVKNVQPSRENPGVDELDPEFILSEEEIVELRQAATNYRDKAFIEFLADTGARVTLATQLKRGDLDLESTPPVYRPNPDGIGHKDVAVKDYVLHDSVRHLKLYLKEAHPDEHPDAPLFALERGYDPEDRENGAISVRNAFERLRMIADTAGIERDRAHPHNLRKSAVVRMRMKYDMSWSAIQKRMEWSDSALPKMKETYRAIENRDEIQMVAQELGYAEPEEGAEDAKTIECRTCGRMVSPADDYCRDCGADPRAEPVDPVQSELGRAFAELDTPTARTLLDAIEAIPDE